MFEDIHQNGYANVAWVIAKWRKRKGAGSQKDSQICCGQFISKIAKKSRVLTDEIIHSLSTPVYCRDLDSTTLRELIDSEDRLIPDIPVDDAPRVGAYNSPGYAQPQYDQYYQQYYPQQPPQQKHDDEEDETKSGRKGLNVQEIWLITTNIRQKKDLEQGLLKLEGKLDVLGLGFFNLRLISIHSGYRSKDSELNGKAYIILNKHTRKVKESLNVTLDETPPPSKTSPLVNDDLDEKEAIKVTEKKNLENDIVDETLDIDEIVNIKESRNHPLENVIGNFNQRTLRSQAQNQSNLFCFISTIEPKNVNEALGDESWIVAMQEELNQFAANYI
ncbi:hypothetical protein Tco_0361372 [Tanacetum coccineum]